MCFMYFALKKNEPFQMFLTYVRLSKHSVCADSFEKGAVISKFWAVIDTAEVVGICSFVQWNITTQKKLKIISAVVFVIRASLRSFVLKKLQTYYMQ